MATHTDRKLWKYILSMVLILVIINIPLAFSPLTSTRTFNNGGTISAALPISEGWHIKTQLPINMTDMAAVSYGGNIYVFGGYGASATTYLNNVYEYFVANDTWVARASMLNAKWGSAAAVVGNMAYDFGGFVSPGTGTSDVEAYNFTSNTWSTRAALPASLGNQGLMAVTVGSNVYLFYQNYAYYYTPSTDTYSSRLASPSSQRTWGTCAYVHMPSGEDRIYIIGGYDYATGGYASDLNQYYSVTYNTWSSSQSPAPYFAYGVLRDNPVIGTGNHTAIFYGFGLDDSNVFHTDLYAYFPRNNTWTSPLSKATYSRDGLACAVVNGILYAIGGRNIVGTGDHGLPYNEQYVPETSLLKSAPAASPIFSDPTYSTANAGNASTFSVMVIDSNDLLSKAWLQTNVTGTYQNSSLVALSGYSSSASTQVTLPATVGVKVGWQWFANTTTGAKNNTALTYLTTTRNYASPMSLTVSGANILRNGQIIKLRGINWMESGFDGISCTGDWYHNGDWPWGYAYTHWDQTGCNQRFAEMSGYGFNIVRLCVDNSWFTSNAATSTGGATDIHIQDAINRTILTAQNYGVYIVLSWHSGAFSSISQYVSLWTLCAQLYGKYPNFLFEIWGETVMDYSTWETGSQQVIAAIRQYTNDICIIQYGYCGDLGFVLDIAPLVSSYGNIVYSQHIYNEPPGATFAPVPSGGPTSVADLTNILSNTWHYSEVIGKYPFFCTETGAYIGDSGELTYWTNLLTVLDNFGASYVCWEWGQFGTGWDLQSSAGNAPYAPNSFGQALINAIPL